MGNRWIYRRKRPSASFRIFCFPYAGGSAAAYHDWQDEFPDEIEVCAIEPPGRRHRIREEPFRRLPDLAEAVVDGLAEETDLPFAFFGHSLGAVVAFEAARRLRSLGGRQPSVLFLSGAGAPHLPRARRTLWDLPEPELVAELHAYEGTPLDILEDPTFRAAFLPIVRADFEAFETYSYDPDPSFDGPVYLYGGESDGQVSAARLSAWRDLVDVVSIEVFRGGHFYLRDECRALTASIRRGLDDRLGAADAA